MGGTAKLELTNELHLAVPIEEAWLALTDLERVAPCMPGAQLQEVEGEEYRGIVKVKVGAISAQYKGTARMVEREDGKHRAVLLASARETRGQGNATARVTAVLTPAGEGTTLSLVTDLSITGKVAQFGRSVLADVSSKLLGQFAQQLEVALQASRTDGPSAAAGQGSAGEMARPAVRTVDGPAAAPVDLMEVAGPALMKRAVPAAALVMAFVLAVSMWLRRRGKGSRP